MDDRAKVIKELELIRDYDPMFRVSHDDVFKGYAEDALALLKAQETGLERIAEDHGLTVDGVSFALDQYQTIICEITHGMMSKLSYRASDVLQVAQERWCDTCELKEAQEPVEPIRKVIGCGWRFFCGKCGNSIVSQQHFCEECGQAVKWG